MPVVAEYPSRSQGLMDRAAANRSRCRKVAERRINPPTDVCSYRLRLASPGPRPRWQVGKQWGCGLEICD